jgi:Zn-dependent membrane protease YugP
VERIRPAAKLAADPVTQGKRAGSQIFRYSCPIREMGMVTLCGVGRSGFLDMCSSWRVAGCICTIAHQDKYGEVFPASDNKWDYWSRGCPTAAGLAGIGKVAILSTPGMLSDHYDPRSKTLRLSQEVYFAPSIAAAGIAAHEAGHALQDAVDYFPMEARTYIVPMVQLATQTAPWVFIAGALLHLSTLAWIGVILFGSSTLFALITLPVEFDASARAKHLLISQHIIQGDQQIAGVQKVLGAAAWTYVAAAVSAIGSWLFYIFVLLSPARSSAYRN